MDDVVSVNSCVLLAHVEDKVFLSAREMFTFPPVPLVSGFSFGFDTFGRNENEVVAGAFTFEKPVKPVNALFVSDSAS